MMLLVYCSKGSLGWNFNSHLTKECTLGTICCMFIKCLDQLFWAFMELIPMFGARNPTNTMHDQGARCERLLLGHTHPLSLCSIKEQRKYIQITEYSNLWLFSATHIIKSAQIECVHEQCGWCNYNIWLFTVFAIDHCVTELDMWYNISFLLC